ncbi:MAG TPA: sulfotransferase domain-containing protein, partial [Polyangiales bacterium]|nr:sulfotransferase domain-containing protein [Polyangiales bacterium]
YGSWFRHVSDWRRRADQANVCVLSYEALQRDPEPALHALALLCQVTLSPPRVRTILDCSSFAAMKRLEDKFDHARAETSSRVASGAFVRSGRVGEHVEVLSEPQQRSFELAMRMHGTRRLPELRLSAFLR